MKRVLIVEDHPIMRFGLGKLVDAAPDLQVCGEAGTLAEALDQCKAEKPDLVIADVSLPDGERNPTFQGAPGALERHLCPGRFDA